MWSTDNHMAAPSRDKIAKYGLGCGGVVFLLGLIALCLCPLWFLLAALLALAPIMLGTRFVRVAGLGLGAASVFMAISQFREMPKFNPQAAPIADSLFVLNGVPIRASVQEVVDRLGQPHQVTDYIDTTLTDTLGHFSTASRSVWQYGVPGIEVQFADSQVVYMECAVRKPCALPLGIGLGTTRAYLESRLGSPARSSRSSVRYTGRTRDCDIRFRLDEADRVSAIRLLCDYPGHPGGGAVVPPN